MVGLEWDRGGVGQGGRLLPAVLSSSLPLVAAFVYAEQSETPPTPPKKKIEQHLLEKTSAHSLKTEKIARLSVRALAVKLRIIHLGCYFQKESFLLLFCFICSQWKLH